MLSSSPRAPAGALPQPPSQGVQPVAPRPASGGPASAPLPAPGLPGVRLRATLPPRAAEEQGPLALDPRDGTSLAMDTRRAAAALAVETQAFARAPAAERPPQDTTLPRERVEGAGGGDDTVAVPRGLFDDAVPRAIEPDQDQTVRAPSAPHPAPAAQVGSGGQRPRPSGAFAQIPAAPAHSGGNRLGAAPRPSGAFAQIPAAPAHSGGNRLGAAPRPSGAFAQIPTPPSISDTPSTPAALPADGASPVEQSATILLSASAFPLPETKAPPTAARKTLQSLGQGSMDESATIEVDRIDPADLALLLPINREQQARELAQLRGPLERRQAEAPTEENEAVVRRRKAAQRGRLSRRWNPALLWLIPLGLCTLVTLALAGWVMIRQPGRPAPATQR